MEATTVPNFKGGEGEYVVKTYLDEQNRIMQGLLPPGASIGMHMHEKNSEIYYIISGTGHVVMDDGTEEDFTVGEMHYCLWDTATRSSTAPTATLCFSVS